MPYYFFRREVIDMNYEKSELIWAKIEQGLEGVEQEHMFKKYKSRRWVK